MCWLPGLGLGLLNPQVLGRGALPYDVPHGAEEEEGDRVEGDRPQDERLHVHLDHRQEEVCGGRQGTGQALKGLRPRTLTTLRRRSDVPGI